MPKKILVVDDEPDIVKLLFARLKAAGYTPLAAYDGEEALKAVRESRPDLIVLDIMLPKLDGYQVCRLLKFDTQTSMIPIILLTARAQDADRKMGMDVGADAYINKPFDAPTVFKKIEELLKKSAAQENPAT